ncbi:RL18 [Hepatospora eriocheir]|uniref:RL18 n=1 Tax=Hepatospora eriocheir TaxID=1081669 RepID=A0A1X0QGE2_9MICR|nr:RL18 [Hepatospora eriocheir]
MKNTLRELPFSVLGGRKKITAENPQLIKLQKFFKKVVESIEDAPLVLRKIEKRLRTTNRVRQPVKVSMIAQNEKVASGEYVAVVVAKVLDDEEILKMPPMKILALKISKSARAKIEKNGGSVYTLDQFMKVGGSLDKLEFIAQDPNHRQSAKYWGLAPGEKGSTAYPRANNKKCKNKEKRLNVKKPMKFIPEDEE